MKSKQSSSKKAWNSYESFTNCSSNLTNRVLRDVISNLFMAVDSLPVNNIPTIYNSRAMQEPTIPSTPTESPVPS